LLPCRPYASGPGRTGFLKRGATLADNRDRPGRKGWTMDRFSVELTGEELTYLLGRVRHQLSIDRYRMHKLNSWSQKDNLFKRRLERGQRLLAKLEEAEAVLEDRADLR
jgi:hypothetical protein